MKHMRQIRSGSLLYEAPLTETPAVLASFSSAPGGMFPATVKVTKAFTPNFQAKLPS